MSRAARTAAAPRSAEPKAPSERSAAAIWASLIEDIGALLPEHDQELGSSGTGMVCDAMSAAGFSYASDNARAEEFAESVGQWIAAVARTSFSIDGSAPNERIPSAPVAAKAGRFDIEDEGMRAGAYMALAQWIEEARCLIDSINAADYDGELKAALQKHNITWSPVFEDEASNGLFFMLGEAERGVRRMVEQHLADAQLEVRHG